MRFADPTSPDSDEIIHVSPQDSSAKAPVSPMVIAVTALFLGILPAGVLHLANERAKGRPARELVLQALALVPIQAGWCLALIWGYDQISILLILISANLYASVAFSAGGQRICGCASPSPRAPPRWAWSRFSPASSPNQARWGAHARGTSARA